MNKRSRFHRQILTVILAVALGLTAPYARPDAGSQEQEVSSGGGGQHGHVIVLPAPPDPGAIGTSVDAIQTYVREVRLSPPASVHRLGLEYSEIRGTIAGIGWGGTPDSGGFRSCPYGYELPFLLRIPPDWDGGLVIFRHEYDLLQDLDVTEATRGERNFFRVIHETGDRQLSDVALHPNRRWAYFAVNQTGTSPGPDPGTFVHNTLVLDAPGCTAGEAVQSTRDAAIARDHAMLAQYLLKRLRDREVIMTLGVGFVHGASTHFAVNAGLRPDLVRTGDNHRIPYDLASGLIFNGFIWIDGFPATNADASLAGLSAPTILLYGDATSNEQRTAMNQIGRIEASSPLRALPLARAYSLRNVPLLDSDWILAVTRDSIDFAGPDANGRFYRGRGERIRPLMAALLDALALWVTDGTPPPTSLFNGTLIGSPPSFTRIDFVRASSPPATVFPYVDDRTLDSFTLDSTPTTPNAAARMAWNSARTALGATIGSIVLPETACRRGRFNFTTALGPSGTDFVPFDDTEFLARWGTAAAHQLCRTQTIDALIAGRFYDPTFVSVDIDPDRVGNSIDLSSPERLVVAIFSSDGFDATQIAPGSVRLAGVSQQGSAPNPGDIRRTFVDLNGDGRKDLRLELRRDRLVFTDVDTVADVWGQTQGGVPFSGSDLVQIVR